MEKFAKLLQTLRLANSIINDLVDGSGKASPSPRRQLINVSLDLAELTLDRLQEVTPVLNQQTTVDAANEFRRRSSDADLHFTLGQDPTHRFLSDPG